MRIDGDAIEVEHHVEDGCGLLRGECGGDVAEPGFLANGVCGRGCGNELERVGDEVFAGGEEDEVAGGAGDASEGYGAVVGPGGADVEIRVAGVAAFEGVPRAWKSWVRSACSAGMRVM